MQTNLKIVLFGLIATLVFLGLAIAGAGGLAAFFGHPAHTITAIAALLMAGASGLTRCNLSSGEREDRANRWVLWAFAVLGLPSAFLPPFTERLDFWTFGGEGVRWLGVALYILGGVLRMVPVFVLGNRFSGLVAIQPGHSLVTGGIYGVIRHPSYLGLLVNAVGWALVFRSGAGVLLAALMLVPVIGRIEAEEKLLASTFGAPYEAYRAHTARLLPGLY